MKRDIFYIEVTDTFGGETNYCWIRRYAVRATTERGAMRVVGKHEGFAMRSDGWRFNYVGACICAYVVDCEPEFIERDRYISLNF